MRGAKKIMVWARGVRINAIPMDLEGAPKPLFVRRRIIEDLEDDNKVLEGDFVILLSREYLAQAVCEESRNVEASLFYCEHPQYLAMMNVETAALASREHVDRKRKIEYDFGI
jgi:hypothetical protein